MMNELISLIVPIYKVEEYLDKCVQSLVNQTYSNLEIILVDDGSPDRCPEICDKWAAQDSRIQVIHQTNGGLGAARNAGLDVTRGEWIVFVDSDDYLPIDSVESLYQQSQLDGSDLVVGGYYKIYPDGRPEEPSPSWDVPVLLTGEEAMRKIHSDVDILHCCAVAKLYRKEIFENIRFSSLKFAEDTQIWPRVIRASKTISVIPKQVYYYLQRSTSIVNTKTDVQYMDGLRCTLDLANYFYDLEIFEEAYFYYRWTIMQTLPIRDKKKARVLIRDSFPKDRQKRIASLDIKAKICYAGLYIPLVHRLVRGVLRLR